MKTLGISSSPRLGGNTDAMIREVLHGASSKGAETTFINISQYNITGCVSCMHCRKKVGCAIQDDMQKVYDEIVSADIVVLGSPVYMGQVNGQFKVFMDRLFPFVNVDFTSKINKPSMLIFSQGRLDSEPLQPYFKMTADVLGVLGFKIKVTYTGTDANMPGAVAGRPEVLSYLLDKGAELVSTYLENNN